MVGVCKAEAAAFCLLSMRLVRAASDGMLVFPTARDTPLGHVSSLSGHRRPVTIRSDVTTTRVGVSSSKSLDFGMSVVEFPSSSAFHVRLLHKSVVHKVMLVICTSAQNDATPPFVLYAAHASLF